MDRTTSTFSCDIAYSDSPAASRPYLAILVHAEALNGSTADREGVNAQVAPAIIATPTVT